MLIIRCSRPAKHHQVSVNNFFCIISAKTQPFCKMSLGSQAITSKRIENLVVNKEQRVPDIASFRTDVDPASDATTVILHGQEFHTTYWGHLALLNLTRSFLLPDYTAYANTAAASLFPSNATIDDLAHQQHALVGYAHPFDIEVDPYADATLRHSEPLDEALELPVDAALGKIDYIEALGFSDHRDTAAIWYRLLNCGFRLPAAAGSDTMADYASLRGPVGLTRVYAGIPKGASSPQPLLDGLKRGRTFATNGPLLGFTLGQTQHAHGASSTWEEPYRRPVTPAMSFR